MAVQQRRQPDPVEVARGVTVEDAFVDFNLGVSNLPTLYAFTSDPLPQGEWSPIEDDPENDPWLVDNGYGLVRGWQEGLPGSEETERESYSGGFGSGWARGEVEHAEIGKTGKYESFEHVVKMEQNRREPASAMSVSYSLSFSGRTVTLTTLVEVADRIVDRYVNGPLGTDTVPYWYAFRERTDRMSWRHAPNSPEDYDGLLEVDVDLVRDDVYTWVPKPVEDVSEADTVFGE